MTKYSRLLLLIVFIAFCLRFFKLSSYPPGLYSDEAALGYNAYSILKTGRDEFGKFLPLTLRSFGDYKPPLSSYLMMPPIIVFGLNEFSVRFPSALLGTLSVILIYFLSLKIFEKEKNKQKIALLSALFLTISPWHLHQSRSAMLVAIEVFFNAAGVLLFLKGLESSNFLFLSSLSFCLAVYTYYGSRVTAPLLILTLLLVFRKKIFTKKTHLIKFFLGFLILIPLFLAILKDPQTLLGRAKYMSIFYDKNVWGQLWHAQTLDGSNFPTGLSRFFHNKPYYYAKDIVRRWLQHFDVGFLFINGEPIAPFQIPNMGLLYLIDLPFFLIGIYWLVKKSRESEKFVLWWLLIAPFVASLTFMTPASNRSFNMIFPIQMIIAYGLATFLEGKSIKWSYLVGSCYLVFVIYYFYQYYHNIPYQIPQKWHYGRRQLVNQLQHFQNNYHKVILTNKGGPPYIFLLFYQKFDPSKYRETVKINPYITDLGWGHIDGFANYEIPREFDWITIKKEINTLYVSYEEEVPDIWQEAVERKQLKVNILKKIYYPKGGTAYKIFDLQDVTDK